MNPKIISLAGFAAVAMMAMAASTGRGVERDFRREPAPHVPANRYRDGRLPAKPKSKLAALKRAPVRLR